MLFNKRLRSLFAFLLIVLLFTTSSFSQLSSGNLAGGDLNSIQTAVPFLTIAPDSRAGAMGDVGVATSPDINSQHWNPAKYVFMEGQGGAALSYTPWLRNLINDINLAYLVGYKKIDGKQAISGSLRYFSLGNIVFTDIYGIEGKTFNPNEFAVDAAYSRLFSDKFSGSMAFRFILTDLTGGYSNDGSTTSAGISVAADLAFYYTDQIDLFDKNGNMSFGTNISNMGRKISYSKDGAESFIPTNFRLGGSLMLEIDDYNSFTVSADINKLLVPTPPIYSPDVSDSIILGKDPNVSVPVGMFHSFYDAPDGFKEEMREFMIGGGVEYLYRNQFAVRGGYFHENALKGNRKYFTFGVGLKLNIFELDFAYLVPTTSTNPLANTVRFTLGFDFDKYRKAQ